MRRGTLLRNKTWEPFLKSPLKVAFYSTCNRTDFFFCQVPVPSQMMGLLPPPPQGGWPEGFMLDRVAKEMQESETWVGTASLSKFVRVGPG